MFNQSAYLKNAPQFILKTTNDSLYKLRANQPKGGLCTIECIIEVLRMKRQNKMASALLLKFDQFNGSNKNKQYS
ncbi:MAG: DTW domain-containing protein [Colwellia sp.]